MTQPDAGYMPVQRPPEVALTARNLEDFILCPRKYLLSYFFGRRQTAEFIGGPAALHRAVRGALLQMYAARRSGACPLDVLLEAFEGLWDGSLCRDSKEEEDLHRQGILMLKRHWEQPLEPAGDGWEVDVRIEQEIGGRRFVAVADLAVIGSPRLVRFTTSRRPPSPGQLPDSLSWGLLYLVGSGWVEAAGAPVDELVCVMADLRRGRRVEYALDEKQRARLEARVTGLAGRIRREREFPPATGKHCRWCRSRRDCPAWQRS